MMAGNIYCDFARKLSNIQGIQPIQPEKDNVPALGNTSASKRFTIRLLSPDRDNTGYASGKTVHQNYSPPNQVPFLFRYSTPCHQHRCKDNEQMPLGGIQQVLVVRVMNPFSGFRVVILGAACVVSQPGRMLYLFQCRHQKSCAQPIDVLHSQKFPRPATSCIDYLIQPAAQAFFRSVRYQYWGVP